MPSLLQQVPPPLAASDAEWNRLFMRRWRAVKKRAYLQVGCSAGGSLEGGRGHWPAPSHRFRC